MTTPACGPLVAVFADQADAEAAVDELRHEGFDKRKIGMATPGEPLHQAVTANEPMEEAAGDAAVKGAVAGTAVGVVAGTLAVATIPGLGPVLVGGALMGMALGAAAGAALGTFAGPFLAMGASKEATKHYESQFRAGRSIVVVNPQGRTDKATLILKEYGPLEMWLPDGTRQVFRA